MLPMPMLLSDFFAIMRLMPPFREPPALRAVAAFIISCRHFFFFAFAIRALFHCLFRCTSMPLPLRHAAIIAITLCRLRCRCY